MPGSAPTESTEVPGPRPPRSWYQTSRSSSEPGTDVYAPVDGTVVGITDYTLSNRTFGARIDIRPQLAPSVVVSLTHLRADPALTVGSAVSAARTKVGVVVDLTAVERQALARYTQDAGNNVSLSVRPAAVLSLR